MVDNFFFFVHQFEIICRNQYHHVKVYLLIPGAAESRTPVQNQYLLKNYTYTIDYLGYSQPTFRSNLYDGFISHHFVF